jgi:hypothetical protein
LPGPFVQDPEVVAVEMHWLDGVSMFSFLSHPHCTSSIL